MTTRKRNQIDIQRERAIEEMAQTPTEVLLEILPQIGLFDKDFVQRVESIIEREEGNRDSRESITAH